MAELVFNSEFSEAMRATFPVIRPEDTAADFTDLAGWRRNAKGGRYRWWKGEGFSVYRTNNNRWRWLVRRTEDETGEFGQVFTKPQTYFSAQSFATVRDAVANIAREYMGTRAE